MDNKKPIVDTESGVFVPPSIQERGEDWQKRDGLYSRTFVVDEFPKSIDFGWYSKVCNGIPCFSGTVEVDPLDSNDDYISEPTEYTSNLYSRRYRQEYDRDQREFRTRRAIERTQRSTIEDTRQTSYFKVAVFFECKSKSKLELEILTNRLYEVALRMGFSVRPIKGRHEDAISAASPVDFGNIEYYTIFDNDIAAHLMYIAQFT